VSAEAQDALWDMLVTRVVVLATLDLADVPRMRELMRKYRDRPMDLADATLVRVAEREKIRTVFTIDRRDFEVYRPSRSWRFSIVPR
jgi:predicted nucleic acid-binding protein